MNAATDSHQPEIEFESTDCPICDGREARPFRRGRDLLHRTSGEFQLVRCQHCRHVYLNPRPTLQSIGAFYPADYAPHHLADGTSSSEETNSLKGKLRAIPGLRRLIHWMTDSSAEVIPAVESEPKRALELGCADGRFLARLRELGWNVQGVEFSEDAAAVARQRGFDVQAGTLESAQLSDRCIESVFAWMVIEHLHDPVSTLNEIHRVLSNDGWFVFSVPNFGCWEPAVFRRYWHAFDLPRHLQHFTKSTLSEMLKDTGFDLVQIVHHRTAYNITGSLGLVFQSTFPKWLGRRLLRFTDNPTILGILLLSPLARLLALFGQSGMLTVVARKKSEVLSAT